MIVGEIVDKINEIDRLVMLFDQEKLNTSNFEELIDLVIEYRDELLKKRVN